MSQDEFTKLFKYVQEMRNEMRNEMREGFAASVHEHTELRSASAELGLMLKDYHQEMIMLGHKVDRMDRWIHEIADKTGIKLSYS